MHRDEKCIFSMYLNDVMALNILNCTDFTEMKPFLAYQSCVVAIVQKSVPFLVF